MSSAHPADEAHVANCPECKQRAKLEQPTASVMAPPALPAEPPPPELERGAKAGRYVVISKLGEGGMGAVYEGYDPELGRRVALKVLHQKVGGSEAAAWLLREAQALAQLSHPNVVAVYDVQRLGDGAVCMAMEYLQGQTLREWVKEKPRAWHETLDVMLAAGDGLAAAHQVGLVHRDFKPSNVLVASDGRTRVLDFGLARIGPSEPGAAVQLPAVLPDSTGSGSQEYLRASLTQGGHVPGTLGYMAPEQLNGAPASVQTDVFSYAVTLYELLFGARPFNFQGAGAQQWQAAVPSGSHGVPRAISAQLLRALSKEPSERPADMTALLTGLRRARGAPARRRLAAAVTAAVLLVVAAAAANPLGLGKKETPCQGAELRLAATWGPAQHSEVQAAFAAAAGPVGAERFARTAAVLDAWAADWVRGQTAACEDTHVRKEVPESMLALRVACYDARRRSFAALVELFAHADRDVVTRSTQAALELPAVQRCDDLALLQAVGSSAVARGARPVPAEARDSLERARAQVAAGKMAAARPLAQAALDAGVAARAVDFEGESALLLGVIEEDFDVERGKALLEQSVRAALASGDDEQLFQSFLRLAITTSNLGDSASERRWVELADAALWRRPDREKRLPLVQSMRAEMAAFGGEPELAKKLCAEVSASLEHSTLPAPQRASILNLLAIAFGASREDARAAELFERAWLLRKEALGPGHLDTLKSQANLAISYNTALQRQGEALTHFQEIWRQCEANGLDHHLFCIAVLSGQAEMLGELGRYDEAIALFEQSHAQMLKIAPKDSLQPTANRYFLGRTLLAMGDFARAIAVLEKMVEELPKGDVGESYKKGVLALVGQARWRSGQKAVGLPLMEKGLADAVAGTTQPVDVELLRFDLARAVFEKGDRARGATLAREAAEGYGKRKREKELAEVEAWLEANSASNKP